MSIDEQQAYLEEENEKLDQVKNKQEKVMKKFAYELRPVEQIQKELNNCKTNFYDIAFPPEDDSAFE